MSLTDEYYAAKKKRKEASQNKSSSTSSKPVDSLTSGYYEAKTKRQTQSLHRNSRIIPTVDIAPTMPNRLTIEEAMKLSAAAKDDDIAPVKDERKWFQKGQFEDGYQFGDITKTILGTGGDTGLNLLTGIVDMGEKAVDALAWLAPAASQSMQAQNNPYYSFDIKQYRQDQEKAGEFIKKDLYDEEAVARKIISGIGSAAYLSNITQGGGQIKQSDIELARQMQGNAEKFLEEDLEDYSVLGEKSDALVQSAGQLAAQVGLQAVGVPWFVTSGVTSFGSEAENALNEGATFEQAGASAAISAGAEVLSEKLFGGDLFVKGAGSDLATKYLATAISNKTLRNLAKFGIDAGGEGIEEVFSQVMSNLGSSLYKEENLGEILFNEEALDEYLESFIGGGVLGGGMSAVNAVQTKKSGKDYATGLTANEQKVVDAVYKDMLAEKDGKLSAKEKAKIYDDVLREMERGEISTEKIEELFGGEKYESYQDLLAEEDVTLKELSELYEGEELQRKVDDFLANSKRFDLQKQLSEEVSKTVSGDRLFESYMERGRRSQHFEADVTQYDEKQRAIVQSAIDSGVLNNTRRSHEMVDLIAKIAADKGVTFDFANNEKIANSGFAVEGATVNGYVTADGHITLNVESPKYLNSTVGHELTHVLEGTELYAELQNTLFEYAKGRKSTNSRFQSEYHERLHNALKLYEGKEGYLGQEGYKKIQNEVAADLVGDYIFTDDAFIRKLSTENRSVFEKIYDEIKYLCKIVTAGSKEARELERVKKAFEDAYRGENSGKAHGKTNYSLSGRKTPTYEELTAKNPVHIVNVKSGIESGSYADMKAAALKKATDEGWFDAPHHNEDTDSLIFLTEKSFTHAYSNLTADFGEDTIRCMAHIPEIIQNAVLAHVADPKDATKQEKKVYTFFGAIEGVNGTEPVKLTVKEFDFTTLKAVPQNIRSYFEKNGAAENYSSLYDAHALEVIGIEGIKKEPDASVKVYGETPQARDTSDSTISVADLLNLVNGDAAKYVPKKNDSDSDIRFSLSGSVEETKDLIAMHNVFPNKLMDALKLGGLPSPSIAITKKDIVHDNYGPISMLLHKESIDPEADSRNKVYGSDAWTPTSSNARTEYEVDYDKMRSFEKRLAELSKKTAGGAFVSESLVRRLGIEDVTEYNAAEAARRLAAYDEVRAAYLAEKGKTIEPEYKAKVYSKFGNKPLQTYIDRVGVQHLASVVAESYTGEMAAIRGEEATVRQIIRDNYAEERAYALNRRPELKEQRINKYMENNVSAFTIEDFVKAAWQFYEEGGAVTEEVDRMATSDKLREAVTEKEIIEWLEPQIEEFFGEPGIYNGKDVFTRSGKRRSFAETHYSYTAENIVKAMQQASDRGETWGGVNANTIIATATPSYGSIDEIRADKGRLMVEDKAAYDQILADIDDSLSSIESDIIRTTKHQTDNMYDEEQIIGGIIAEAASGTRTAAAVQKAFSKEGYKISTDQAKRILHLYEQAAAVPTGYFESKPQRVVGFDEVAVVVIPYDSDAKLKQELLNNGLSIAEYDPNVEGDRQRVVNQFEDLAFSLSNVGETPTTFGNYHVSGKDVMYTPEDIAPVRFDVANSVPVNELFPDDGVPIDVERENITKRMQEIMARAKQNPPEAEVKQLVQEYTELGKRLSEIDAADKDRFASIDDADVPPEVEAPYYEETGEMPEPDNPFEDRDWYEVGKRNVKAYMYENPEVKPFFQAEAEIILGELRDTVKGERHFNSDLHYDTGGEYGWTGTKRMTSDSIAQMKDDWGYTYAEIEKGLNAIIEDHGAENIAAAKKIEFIINDRLLNGYKAFGFGMEVPPNEDYIKLLNEKQITEYSKEAFDALVASGDEYAPPVEDIAPLAKATPDTDVAPIYEAKDKKAPVGQTTMFEPPKPNPKVATVLSEEVAAEKKKSGVGKAIVSQVVDKGMAVENLSLKTGNMELQAKYNSALPTNTEAKAQYFMEHGAAGVTSLKDIMKAAEETGKSSEFCDYLYHVHNIDRMTLDKRFGIENKTVFGETVTADVSKKKVAQYEKANPAFKAMAEKVYAYNKHLRKLLVDGGVISQDTADLWEKMYPHYVPVRRVDSEGLNVSVPLDTKKTGVNAPIKRATGGSSDILPLFNTMAQRTEQTYRAIARNAFGVELKNTLGTTIDTELDAAGVDEVIDTIVSQDEQLLKPGTLKSNPTFTVFENGERVEFEITEDMYDALKPAGKVLGYRNKAVNKVSNWRRNLLTTWNPVFALYRNPVKDLQEVAINSQHPVKTYANIPKAIYEIAAGGEYATEYHQNGGKSNTYFDSRENKFKDEDNIFKKTIGLPIRAIETAGEFIEEIPRLAEYIASRNEGRSVDRSMLDAARVTTNFAAGGDFTKFFNSHGFNFLNASVQGFSQHVRNFREAKQQGLKGYVKVLAKYTVAGLAPIVLNSMLWDDDEEYEELSDYVKQNYWVVAKTKDGKFVRIPKGRTAAVMQNAFEQMQNLVTGDDEVDFGTFSELFMNNIAPSNPIENNILAPIIQAKNNKAWYGDDLVPARLQDLPAAEQFDESTDSISKWLGEATNTSPYKWNYLIDQYSGGMGDMFLPMLTPEAESGDNSFMGNMLAPWKKELTTDSVLNNKNPGDFYDLKDELEIKANAMDATEEDAMRTMYMDSVSWDMSDLYKKKREVQSSDLPDDEKYEEVRSIQEQINELANGALDGYNDVRIEGLYSEVGDRRYNKDADSGKWYEIQAKNSDGSANYFYEQEQKVTKRLGISSAQYWNNREEYDYAYDKPEKYALSQAVGGYKAYKGYTSELWDIKADKDENGKSINGSRKSKVIDYINELDADYGEKIILFKSEYNADDTYNEDIIDYLNSRDDIDYQEMETILKELGFEVDSNGKITW